MELNPLIKRNINPVLATDDGISEYFKNLNTEKAVEHKEKLLYLMFENDQNNCWLDASIVLIANSKAFEDAVEGFPSSEIKSIITTYRKALSILNDSNGLIQERMERTRMLLQGIQRTTLNSLKQFLKFKSGEPESAFCALLNLIIRDSSNIKEKMTVSWIWKKNCENCGVSKFPLEKTIITLPKVNEFNPQSPTCVYTCSSCKKEQEMKLIYKELPSCLIFHFEKGAGTGNNLSLSFRIDAREYHLTSVILLERTRYNLFVNINHFITWIRQPSVDMWLDCNDLNTNIVQYGRKQPEWELNDLYICVYEANDNYGKISCTLDDSEQSQKVDAEVIYLSDEGEDRLDTPESAQSETIIGNQNEEIPLNYYSNSDIEQPENDLYKQLISNNGEHGVFLTESSQEMSGIEETCDLEKINFIHQNMPLTDALSEMSPGDCCVTGIESENFASESVSLDAPEIPGETHPENITSNALNEKSEFPCIVNVDKNGTSGKSTGDSKLGAVPRNKVNVLAEKGKQKIEDDSKLGAVPRNKANELADKSKEKGKQKIEDDSKLGAVPRNKANELAEKSKEKGKQKIEDKEEVYPKPKLNEASPRETCSSSKLEEKNAKARKKRERPKLSEARARELEHLIDNVTTNVFSNFMGFICKEREKNNS